jgi:hypothetical protein
MFDHLGLQDVVKTVEDAVVTDLAACEGGVRGSTSEIGTRSLPLAG